jgi:hypothetical protein
VGCGWQRRLLIKWKGWAEPTWKLWENFTNVEDLDRFEREFGTDNGVGDPVGA